MVKNVSKGKNVHVSPHPDGWEVKITGSKKAHSVHKDQDAALKEARRLAKKFHMEVFIHGKDGKVRDRDSYGHDPFPPRDKKH